MKAVLLRLATLVIGILVATSIAHGSGVIRYVNKANETGVEDGQAWETAFRTIQAAVDEVYNEGGGEVWIAAGVYDEPRTSYLERFDHLLDIGALMMREGVVLYGGFAGGESSFEERDWRSNVTIIDGANSKNGQGAHHVIYSETYTVLDGLVIQGGVADEFTETRYRNGGGGMRLNGAAGLFRNCTFRDNWSSRSVGGIGINRPERTLDGPQTIRFENCLFENNVTELGTHGAVSSSRFGLAVEFIDCTFRGNSHGAVFGRFVTLENCLFENNRSTKDSSSRVPVVSVYEFGTIRDCTFLNNETDVVIEGANRPMVIANSVFWNNRGTAVYGRDSEIRDNDFPVWHQVVNCTFASPPGADVGPAFDLVWRARVALTNSIVWGHGPAPIQTEAGAPLLVARHSIIEGGFDGTAVLDADPQFADLAGGDLRLVAGSPGIDAGIAEAAFGHPPFPAAPEADLDGRPRPLGAAVDLGAYEYVPADVNGDGEKNAIDLQLVVNAALRLHTMPACDLNGDGTPDAIDVQLMTNALLGVI